MTSVGVRHSHQSPAIVGSLLCIPPCLVEAIITPLESEADGLLRFKLVLHGVPCKHGRWNRSSIENAGYFMGYQ